MPPPFVEPEDFRDATRLIAGHVAVVATRSGPHDHAITATSWTWVSQDPPLVLVCLHEDARITEAVEASGTWTLNVLAADPDRRSRAVARWLATGGRPVHDQLAPVPHHRGDVVDAALVDGALLALECRTTSWHPEGDHVVVVGEVLALHRPPPGLPTGDPLLYFASEYRTAAPLAP